MKITFSCNKSVQVLKYAEMIEILFLLALLASANAAHWEEWMVYKQECGTLEKRCVTDFPWETNPVCPVNDKSCGNNVVYSSWEEAATKINKTVSLKIGNEIKTVPIVISSEGAKYLVFQRRLNGEVDFYRKWNEYVDGFGNPEGEYWIGLRALNILTSTGKFNMIVVLRDFNNTQVFARYGTFEVGGPESYYKLKVGNYSGIAGDGMSLQNNMMFSTQDQDHDTWVDNCAVRYKGAWWYAACHQSNLNGLYFPAPGVHSSYADGVNWYPFRGYHTSMKWALMVLSLK